MELVIGLAITGMMAASGAAAFTSIIDHRETVRKANAATERAAALREMIRSWILNGTVRVDLGGGPRGLSRAGQATRVTMRTGNTVVDLTPAKGVGDQVTIVTSAINPSMMPNMSIRLYIDVDDNTPEKGLTMEYQPNPQSSLTRRMLDSTITTLTLEYLDGRTQRWIESSQAATVSNVRATRISFASSDTSVTARLLSIPITIATPGSNVRTFLN